MLGLQWLPHLQDLAGLRGAGLCVRCTRGCVWLSGQCGGQGFVCGALRCVLVSGGLGAPPPLVCVRRTRGYQVSEDTQEQGGL